jgi:hypothetical protein
MRYPLSRETFGRDSDPQEIKGGVSSAAQALASISFATSADGKRIHQGVTIIITRYSINSPPPAGVALFPRKGGERQIHVANADLCISSSSMRLIGLAAA